MYSLKYIQNYNDALCKILESYQNQSKEESDNINKILSSLKIKYDKLKDSVMYI